MNTKLLRQKILDLAIRGKLVPQDSNDEPASELINKIQAERAELIKQGKLKKDKNQSYIFKTDDSSYYEKIGNNEPAKLDDLPFEIPEGWVWCRLKEIVLINPKNNLDDNLEVSFIPMSLVSSGYNNYCTHEKKIWKEIKSGFTHFGEKDVIVAKISPCFENMKSAILTNLTNSAGAGTTELFVLRPSIGIISAFLLWIIKTKYFLDMGIGNFTGVVGQQRIPKSFVENFLIPLPPLAEQKRIVAKINELFAQIDIIEESLKAEV